MTRQTPGVLCGAMVLLAAAACGPADEASELPNFDAPPASEPPVGFPDPTRPLDTPPTGPAWARDQGLSVSPAALDGPGSTEFCWTDVGAGACQLHLTPGSGGPAETMGVPAAGCRTVSLSAGTTQASLTCGTQTRRVRAAAGPTIVVFDVLPQALPESGGQAQVRFATHGMSTCNLTLDGRPVGAGTDNAIDVAVQQDGVLRLACTYPEGRLVEDRPVTVGVTVQNLDIRLLGTSEASVSWTARFARSCFLSLRANERVLFSDDVDPSTGVVYASLPPYTGQAIRAALRCRDDATKTTTAQREVRAPERSGLQITGGPETFRACWDVAWERETVCSLTDDGGDLYLYPLSTVGCVAGLSAPQSARVDLTCRAPTGEVRETVWLRP